MVLMRLIGSTALAATCLLLCHCVWVDEEAPTGVTIYPADHAPQRNWSDTLRHAPGIRMAKTGEIAAFLGTKDFRIAMMASWYNSSGSDLFVLNPGADTAAPVILAPPQTGSYTGIYPGQGWGLQTSDCHFSPEGDALVFARKPRESEDYLPGTLWMLTLSEPGWLVPLASRANRSLGMIGKYPFWYRSQGESRIAFAGMRLGTDRRGLVIQEMREVEKASDSTVSPVEPLSFHGGLVREILLGLSRDSRWALIRKEEFQTGGVDRRDHLVPADRLADTAFLARRDSLLPYTVGLSSSLNPFEASQSTHTDYYLTLPFRVFGGENFKVPDSLLSPRTLEGRPGMDSAREGDIWICDKDRRIVFSQELPDSDGGRANWVQWTNHPNFILASRGGNVYIVKLAADPQSLLGNPETATLKAAGVFRLLSNLAGGEYLATGASLWVGAAQ